MYDNEYNNVNKFCDNKLHNYCIHIYKHKLQVKISYGSNFNINIESREWTCRSKLGDLVKLEHLKYVFFI